MDKAQQMNWNRIYRDLRFKNGSGLGYHSIFGFINGSPSLWKLAQGLRVQDSGLRAYDPESLV